jgi:hypothetical protein
VILGGASPEWLGAGAAEVLFSVTPLGGDDVMYLLEHPDRAALPGQAGGRHTHTYKKKIAKCHKKSPNAATARASSKSFFAVGREISWRGLMVPLEHALAAGAGLWLP